jgi:hypothetical protein
MLKLVFYIDHFTGSTTVKNLRERKTGSRETMRKHI